MALSLVLTLLQAAGKAKPSLATELLETTIDGKPLPPDVIENIMSMTYLGEF